MSSSSTYPQLGNFGTNMEIIGRLTRHDVLLVSDGGILVRPCNIPVPEELRSNQIYEVEIKLENSEGELAYSTDLMIEPERTSVVGTRTSRCFSFIIPQGYSKDEIGQTSITLKITPTSKPSSAILENFTKQLKL